MVTEGQFHHLSKLSCNPHGLLPLRFRIDLRHIGTRMSEQHLGRLEPEFPSYHGGRAVTQPVGRPLRDTRLHTGHLNGPPMRHHSTRIAQDPAKNYFTRIRRRQQRPARGRVRRTLASRRRGRGREQPARLPVHTPFSGRWLRCAASGEASRSVRPSRLRFIAFGVDLGDICRTVPEDDLGRFKPELLPDRGSRIMPDNPF